MNKLSRNEMAKRIAQDIPEGAYVNLGIGLPTLVANYLPYMASPRSQGLSSWNKT